MQGNHSRGNRVFGSGRFGVAKEDGWNRKTILRHYRGKGSYPFCHNCARSVSETGGYSHNVALARGKLQNGQTVIRIGAS